MASVSVIIVNYNTTALLRQCLDNLRKQYHTTLQILVVDNTSTDALLSSFPTDYPKVVFYLNSSNIGLAAAFNQALKNAKGKYVLFMGTDAFPQKNVITGLTSYLDHHPKVGICTPKLTLRNGNPDKDAHRYFPTPIAVVDYYLKLFKYFPMSPLFNAYYKDYQDMTSPHEIDMCISHFMFVRKEVIVQVGPWDEDYFLYAEDMDFCYRAKNHGWKIMYLPQWETLHYKGASVAVRSTTRDIARAGLRHKTKMFFLSAKGLHLFYLKHYQKTYPFPIVWGIIALAYTRSILKTLRLSIS
jgi:GT2 family glycosyltransferase